MSFSEIMQNFYPKLLEIYDHVPFDVIIEIEINTYGYQQYGILCVTLVEKKL